MMRFLSKTILNDSFVIRKTLQKPLLSQSFKHISTISTDKNSSFTVNYLINSCGFSPESALSASKYVHLKTPQKPDSVLAFFKHHNFTQTQISILLKGNPAVISSDPETLLPKFKFFYSVGISSIDLAKIITKAPDILRRSLKNQIIPSFNFFKNLFPDNEKIILAFKRYPKVILYDVEAIAGPNISTLREFGVPGSNILTLLSQHPSVFLINPDLFRGIVEEVKGMEFNPMRMKFLLAVYALRAMSKSTWNRKLDVYKRWNLSEEEVLVAFGKCPWCMMASEIKIVSAMNYYVSTMGLEALVIINRPVFLCYSLEKRIVPRCSVVQVLLSKALINKNFNLSLLLDSSEKLFMQKFVTCYEEEAPQLLKLYKEKLDLGMRHRLVDVAALEK